MLAARISTTTSTVRAMLAKVHLGSTVWKRYIKFVLSMATINLSLFKYMTQCGWFMRVAGEAFPGELSPSLSGGSSERQEWVWPTGFI